jgi:squalene synthase HpnC
MNQTLESSYNFCVDLARKHYENFPVASLLIPKKKRKFIAAVYAFARIADDIADEGEFSPKERIEKLIEYKNLLVNKIIDYRYPHLLAVFHTIEVNSLTKKNFTDLIDAFIQDNQKTVYRNWDEVLEYCTKSANPVGRILLEIFDIKSKEAFFYSDKICSALQLTNFLQDLKIDLLRHRFYLPQELVLKNNLTNEDLISFARSNSIDERLKKTVEEAVNFTEEMFKEGENLLKFLSGLFKKEISLTINGGMGILSKIRKNNYDTLSQRPTLNKIDWLKILLRAIF